MCEFQVEEFQHATLVESFLPNFFSMIGHPGEVADGTNA